LSQPWRNPDAPDNVSFEDSSLKTDLAMGAPSASSTPLTTDRTFGTEKDQVHCAFFLKTGACRYGSKCSKTHLMPLQSTTLLIRNFYEPLGYSTSKHGTDDDEELMYTDDEIQEHFEAFYNDIHPEFRIYGEIVQLKVCQNSAPHLRGNVYVQYRRLEDAIAAYQGLNGRWYAGKQITIQFSPVTNWKLAICGLYDKNECPHGKSCNFLHPFRNPKGEYEDNIIRYRRRFKFANNPYNSDDNYGERSRNDKRSSFHRSQYSHSHSSHRVHHRHRSHHNNDNHSHSNRNSAQPSHSPTTSATNNANKRYYAPNNEDGADEDDGQDDGQRSKRQRTSSQSSGQEQLSTQHVSSSVSEHQKNQVDHIPPKEEVVVQTSK
jgi:hypothetical protein